MTPTYRNKLVVAHSTREGAPRHEVETNLALARWLAQILGLKFGGKDHTTVLSACRKVEALLDSDPQLRGMVSEIERHLLA